MTCTDPDGRVAARGWAEVLEAAGRDSEQRLCASHRGRGRHQQPRVTMGHAVDLPSLRWAAPFPYSTMGSQVPASTRFAGDIEERDTRATNRPLGWTSIAESHQQMTTSQPSADHD